MQRFLKATLQNSFLFLSFISFALAESVPVETQVEAEKILKSYSNISSPEERAQLISAEFIGRPFVWGPCGEGDAGRYESKPLTRFDQFDCTTYTEAVLGLVFSKGTSYEDFLASFLKIKYACDSGSLSEVCYVNRNHFASINWIPNILSQGRVVDITLDLFNDSPKRMKWLDIETWYQDKLKSLDPKKPEDIEKIAELKKEGFWPKGKALAQLNYIPLKNMLDSEVTTLLKDEGVVVFNMIRNENTKTNIPVIVGHQGFIINKDSTLYIRQASSAHKKVEDVLLIDYVAERLQGTTWPTLGFNILGFKK
ncbi:MAG: DUF1460 domain-containing protein [Bdellovibrionota bacterium]